MGLRRMQGAASGDDGAVSLSLAVSRTLSVAGCSFTGTIPVGISALRSLTRLNLQSCVKQGRGTSVRMSWGAGVMGSGRVWVGIVRQKMCTPGPSLCDGVAGRWLFLCAFPETPSAAR